MMGNLRSSLSLVPRHLHAAIIMIDLVKMGYGSMPPLHQMYCLMMIYFEEMMK